MKSVLVTGSNRGIGLEICIAMAKKGYKIAINYIGEKDDTVLEAERLCKQYTDEVISIYGDVTKMEDCENMVAETVKAFGSLDVLVNNAGITKDNLLMRMSEQDFDAVIAVNLKGAFNMTKVASKAMLKKRYGRIINISSVAGVIGNAGQVNYASSKAGLIGMTKSVARELASRNITANAVAPGFIQTDMTKDLPEEVINKLNVPLKRMGTPQEVANAVLFLAESDYITGQVLSVDGGMAI